MKTQEQIEKTQSLEMTEDFPSHTDERRRPITLRFMGCLSRLVMDWFPSLVEKIVVKLGCPEFPDHCRLFVCYALCAQVSILGGYLFLFARAAMRHLAE